MKRLSLYGFFFICLDFSEVIRFMSVSFDHFFICSEVNGFTLKSFDLCGCIKVNGLTSDVMYLCLELGENILFSIAV